MDSWNTLEDTVVTKGERREARRNNARKMRVYGVSVKLLAVLIPWRKPRGGKGQ